MLTHIAETEAQALLVEAVAREIVADSDWYKQHLYELLDGRCVEYLLAVNDDGAVCERWHLIDLRAAARQA